MNRNAKRKAAQARRNVLLVVALMLVVCIASIGGTLAWLTDKTDEVKNTFSSSEIEVDLVENTPSADKRTDIQIVPGVDITKDPKVSASADVPYYVFVKVVEDNWPDAKHNDERKVSYAIADGWLPLLTHTDAADTDKKTFVYYRELAANEELTNVSVLAGNTVTVSGELTEDDMKDITSTNAPTLSFTAYAMQKQKSNVTGEAGNFTAGDAWNTVKLPDDPAWTASSGT